MPVAQFSAGLHTYTTAGNYEIQMTAVAANGSVYHPPSIPMQIDPTTAVTALNIASNSSSSTFYISADSSGHTIITENNVTIDTMFTNTLLSITITGDAEGVTTVDFANGDPLPPSGLSIDSGQLNILANSSSSTMRKEKGTSLIKNE